MAIHRNPPKRNPLPFVTVNGGDVEKTAYRIPEEHRGMFPPAGMPLEELAGKGNKARRHRKLTDMAKYYRGRLEVFENRANIGIIRARELMKLGSLTPEMERQVKAFIHETITEYEFFKEKLDNLRVLFGEFQKPLGDRPRTEKNEHRSLKTPREINNKIMRKIKALQKRLEEKRMETEDD